jgi:hypothetical protein
LQSSSLIRSATTSSAFKPFVTLFHILEPLLTHYPHCKLWPQPVRLLLIII